METIYFILATVLIIYAIYIAIWIRTIKINSEKTRKILYTMAYRQYKKATVEEEELTFEDVYKKAGRITL